MIPLCHLTCTTLHSTCLFQAWCSSHVTLIVARNSYPTSSGPQNCIGHEAPLHFQISSWRWWTNWTTNQTLDSTSESLQLPQDNWSELLPLAEFTYNNTLSATTSITPFFEQGLFMNSQSSGAWPCIRTHSWLCHRSRWATPTTQTIHCQCSCRYQNFHWSWWLPAQNQIGSHIYHQGSILPYDTTF